MFGVSTDEPEDLESLNTKSNGNAKKKRKIEDKDENIDPASLTLQKKMKNDFSKQKKAKKAEETTQFQSSMLSLLIEMAARREKREEWMFNILEKWANKD